MTTRYVNDIPAPTLTPREWGGGHGTTVETLLTWTPKSTVPTWIYAPYGHAGHYENAGTRRCKHWRVTVLEDGTRHIWHYSTLMLVVSHTGEVEDYSTGHGSVSDQGMMNRLFRALGAPYYFSRKGGASIERTER